MIDLRAAAEMALEALELECTDADGNKVDLVNPAVAALRQALAQPEQEPEVVAVIGNWGRVEWADGVYPQIGDRMYSAPPSKPWVSLTDDDIALLRRQGAHSVSDKHFRAIDALLKEKNT